MEDTIRKLVAIDKACTKRVEEAKLKKIDMQETIKNKREEIYKTFMAEQQQKLLEFKIKLEKENEIDDIEQELLFKQKMMHLEKEYQDNKDIWVTKILERCLS